MGGIMEFVWWSCRNCGRCVQGPESVSHLLCRSGVTPEQTDDPPMGAPRGREWTSTIAEDRDQAIRRLTSESSAHSPNRKSC